jgi:4-methyl-5(b-hydroxyethyl)-thiazole monophosphate biosynthesis
MFLANGFEEIEALCPLDLLRRAGVEVKTVAIGGETLHVTGSHGITVLADIDEKDFADEAPEMVILPGGMPGASNLDASPTVDGAIKSALACDGYLAAICAAPMILGKRDLLVGKRAICFPGFEQYLNGTTVASERVVCDGKMITGAGMGVALDFAKELISLFVSPEIAEKISKSIMEQ